MQISRMDEARLYRLPQGLGGPWGMADTLVGLLGPVLGVLLGACLSVLCDMLVRDLK